MKRANFLKRLTQKTFRKIINNIGMSIGKHGSFVDQIIIIEKFSEPQPKKNFIVMTLKD